MTFAPLADADLALHLHLWTAVLALVLGPFAIYRRRRDALHKALGYAWVMAMALAAASSFALSAFVVPIALGFGVIHLLSVYVLYQLWVGVRDARRRAIAAHKARMSGLYWQGLTVAGVFTFLPGRTLNATFFPAEPARAYWVIAALGLGLLAVNLWPLRPVRRTARVQQDG